MHRSVGGELADISSYRDMLLKQMQSSFADERPPDDVMAKIKEMGVDAYIRSCNPHVCPNNPGLDYQQKVLYLDVNSEYASKFYFCGRREDLPTQCPTRIFFFFWRRKKIAPLRGDLELTFSIAFPASISNGLFYGCSTLYNKDWSLEDDILTRCDRKTKTKSDVHHELLRAASPMNSTESQFVQAVGIHTYPDALYLCSAWHAGLNQVCLGPGSKQRADLLVVDRGQTSKIHQIFWNYDRYRHFIPKY